MVRRTYEKQLASRAAHATTPPYKVNPKMKNFFRKIKNAVMFAVEVQRMLLAPTCRAPKI